MSGYPILVELKIKSLKSKIEISVNNEVSLETCRNKLYISPNSEELTILYNDLRYIVSVMKKEFVSKSHRHQ